MSTNLTFLGDYRPSHQATVFFQLSKAGVLVNGAVAADFDGTHITLVRPNMTTITVALSGANFFDLSASASGLYMVIFDGGDLGSGGYGPHAFNTRPAVAVFDELGYVFNVPNGTSADVYQRQGTPVLADQSADLAAVALQATNLQTDVSTIESRQGVPHGATMSADILEVKNNLDTVQISAGYIQAKTDNLPMDPASEANVENAITSSEQSIKGTHNKSVTDINDSLNSMGSALGAIYAATSASAIAAALLGAVAPITGAVTDGTFGQWLRSAILRSRKRFVVNKLLGTETLFAEDLTTPLIVRRLRDANGAPAGLDAVEVKP